MLLTVGGIRAIEARITSKGCSVGSSPAGYASYSSSVKLRRMTKLVAILVLAIIAVACGPSDEQIATAIAETAVAAATPTLHPCDNSIVEDAFFGLEDILEEWDDAVALADSTPRGSLTQPVENLQRIRRETEAYEVPPCLEKAHEELVTGMSLAINAFLGFMADEPENLVTRRFEDAGISLGNFFAISGQVIACAPSCSTTAMSSTVVPPEPTTRPRPTMDPDADRVILDGGGKPVVLWFDQSLEGPRVVLEEGTECAVFHTFIRIGGGEDTKIVWRLNCQGDVGSVSGDFVRSD